MNIGAELFLSLRYFKPKRDAVSVITLISVVGVALGVAVLIVVLAVMTGFTDLMREKLLETTAHVQVYPYYGASHIAEPEKAAAAAMELGARSAMPLIQRQALVQKGDNVVAKMLIGVDSEQGYGSPEVLRNLAKPSHGVFSLEKNQMMLSEVVAQELDVFIGDKLVVHAPNKLAKMISANGGALAIDEREMEVYLPHEFEVVGIFSFGKYDFDKNVLFVGMDDAAELFGLPWGSATCVYIWADNPFNLEPLAGGLAAKLPANAIYTWQQLNRQLLGVLAVEKNMMLFLLVFIVLVAAFSITNTLITMVVQKTREIGLLKAIGASSGGVMRVFIFQGFFVGFIGTGAGVALGVAVVHWRNSIMWALSKATGMEIFPKEFYFFNELPASVVAADLVVIAAISLLLCTVGGIIPALRAARLDPAAALRYE